MGGYYPPIYAASRRSLDSYCDKTCSAYIGEDSTMPTASTLYLEFDKTGLSPDNLIPYEAHTLLNTATRLIIPKFGAFYTGSLSVFSVYPYTGDYILLTKSVDFITTTVSAIKQTLLTVRDQMLKNIKD